MVIKKTYFPGLFIMFIIIHTRNLSCLIAYLILFFISEALLNNIQTEIMSYAM